MKRLFTFESYIESINEEYQPNVSDEKIAEGEFVTGKRGKWKGIMVLIVSVAKDKKSMEVSYFGKDGEEYTEIVRVLDFKEVEKKITKVRLVFDRTYRDLEYDYDGNYEFLDLVKLIVNYKGIPKLENKINDDKKDRINILLYFHKDTKVIHSMIFVVKDMSTGSNTKIDVDLTPGEKNSIINMGIEHLNVRTD